MRIIFGFHLLVILGGFVAAAYMAHLYGETRSGKFGSITLFLCAFAFIFVSTKMLEREIAKNDSSN